MSGKELLLGLSFIEPKHIEDSDRNIPSKKAANSETAQEAVPMNAKPKMKPWLIAAVIALAMLLVGCAAVVYARIHMKVVQHNIPTAATTISDTGETAAHGTMSAEDIINCYYPQSLPEGYFVEKGGLIDPNSKNIIYRSNAGGRISFTISSEQPVDMVMDAPVEKTEATVSGFDSVLQVSERGEQSLTWHNETEGYYAGIYTTDMSVDLYALAESVSYGKAQPASFLYKDGKLWDVSSSQQIPKPDYTIELEQEDDAYVGWEPIYPQWVPEGFEVSYVSGHAFGSQLIRYENGAGNFINYRLYYRLDEWKGQFDGVGQPEEVSINDKVGYYLGDKLIWTDETKGFGFLLSSDTDVDLIAVAESVAVGPELEETNGDDTAKALEDLGDYQITALPEGMVEDSQHGAPYGSTEGVEWYSGVRRWYVNKETNDQVFFQYEVYHESEVLTVEDMLFNYVAAWPVESFTIHGCPGAAGETIKEGATVAWVSGDETGGVRFRMISKDFTTQELLAMAESVQKK